MSQLEKTSGNPLEKFKTQVSEFRQGLERENLLEDEDNLESRIAILNHLRAIVDEQIQIAPDDDSKIRLIRLREKLGSNIRDLEATPTLTVSNESQKTIAVVVVSVLLILSLLGAGFYLARKQRISPAKGKTNSKR